MHAKTLGLALAGGRLLFGTAFLLAPERSIRGWVGARAARGGGAQLLARAVGARDIALAAGTLAAASSDATRPWFLGAALSDGADFVATAVAPGIPPASRAFGLTMAGISTAVATAAALDDDG